MECSKDESDFECMIKAPSKNKLFSSEKRVEFSIGSPKKSRSNKAKPKSVLKRFNLETHR